MPELDEPLRAGGAARDLADPTYARRSLRASVERRLRRRRRRRAIRGSRRAVVGASCLLTVVAAGALAHQTGTSRSGSSARAGTALAAASGGYSLAAVQRRLGVAADGVMGPRTRRAVRSFQRRSGLVVDGIIGPQTLRALGLAVQAPASTASGDSAGLLARIAQCESGGDPTAVSADGRYRGKYQFSRATWASLGGQGDPAAAPEAEQDARAAALLQRRGFSAWPVCSRR